MALRDTRGFAAWRTWRMSSILVLFACYLSLVTPTVVLNRHQSASTHWYNGSTTMAEQMNEAKVKERIGDTINQTLKNIVRQTNEDPVDQEDEGIVSPEVTEWIDMLFLIAGAGFSLKMGMLWAESRMLRKLKSPVSNVGKDLEEEDVKKRFALMVLSLCKGRNKVFSRIFPQLYQFFIIGSGSWGILVGDLYFMDSFLAIVLPSMVGSFTVLGAGVLKSHEVVGIFVIIIGYGVLVYAAAIGWLGTSQPQVFAVAQYIEWGTVLFTLADTFFDYLKSLITWDSDIFSIAHSISKGCETRRQEERRIEMESIAFPSEPMENPRTRHRYWDISVRRVFVDLVLFATNCTTTVILLQNVGSPFQAARLVSLEMLDMASVILLSVNGALVEPTLFIKLLKLARETSEVDDDKKTEREGESGLMQPSKEGKLERL